MREPNGGKWITLMSANSLWICDTKDSACDAQLQSVQSRLAQVIPQGKQTHNSKYQISNII